MSKFHSIQNQIIKLVKSRISFDGIPDGFDCFLFNIDEQIRTLVIEWQKLDNELKKRKSLIIN
jgi:hypothetical protein